MNAVVCIVNVALNLLLRQDCHRLLLLPLCSIGCKPEAKAMDTSSTLPRLVSISRDFLPAETMLRARGICWHSVLSEKIECFNVFLDLNLFWTLDLVLRIIIVAQDL